jgi:predicted RNase H-like nuclease
VRGTWATFVRQAPSTSRPGIIGSLLSRACDDAGYPIAGTDTPRGTQNRLLEVYPHPALLALLDVDYRFPYKVSKARKLWPKSDAEGRKSAVLDSFARILAALRERIDGIDIDLPELSRVGSLSGLKRYEDALDVLVCCWVGMEYLDGRAEAFGDEDAAIWVPADARLRVQKNRNSLLNGRSSE